MYQLNGTAIRKETMIEIFLMGMLPNSCHKAKIKHCYPGDLVYVKDPGFSQVFIEETIRPGSNFCLMMLFPWVESIKIPDQGHDKVVIYVNEEKKVELKISEEPKEFIVVSLTSSPQKGCSILPKGAFYLAIYTQVFGPATLEECENLVKEKCECEKTNKIRNLTVVDNINEDSDEYLVDSVEIKEDKLVVTVSYTGGCKEHEFKLLWLGDYDGSDSPSIDVNLVHNANDDPCKAQISEELVFDLSNLKPTLINLRNISETLKY